MKRIHMKHINIQHDSNSYDNSIPIENSFNVINYNLKSFYKKIIYKSKYDYTENFNSLTIIQEKSNRSSL